MVVFDVRVRSLAPWCSESMLTVLSVGRMRAEGGRMTARDGHTEEWDV